MSYTSSYVINAGQTLKIQLPNWAAVATIILSNSTQFDLIWSGFGVQGQVDIPGGHQWKLDASVFNSGTIYATANDVLNVGGAGPISITQFLTGEPLPQGTWPVTVPAQRVIVPTAGAVVADHLTNTGNVASASPIIEIQQAGSTGDNLFADNQGNFFVQQYVSSVLTAMFRTIAGVSPGGSNVLLSDASHQAEVVGKMLFDLAATFGINAPATSLAATLPAGQPAFLVSGFNGASGGSTGFLTQSNANDDSFQSFNAQHTGSPGANSIGFYMQGGCRSGFHTVQTSGVPFVPNNSIFAQANGSVGGNLQLYIAMWGISLKLAWVYLNGLNTATNTIVVFPSTMQSGIILPGDIGGSTTAQLFNGGSAVGARQGIYATANNTAGTSGAVTVIHAQGFYTFLGTIDRIAINTTGGSGINNGIMIMGY